MKIRKLHKAAQWKTKSQRCQAVSVKLIESLRVCYLKAIVETF